MKEAPKFKNRRASYDYELLDSLDCGIVLVGTEVKSLRFGKCSLDGSWVKIENKELWLVGCDISKYDYGTHINHNPKRDRKLLAKRQEIRKFGEKAIQKGLTLIPTVLYFNEKGKVKVTIALAQGKRLFDKRESIKDRDMKRERR